MASLLLALPLLLAAAVPPHADEPVIYTGGLKPDRIHTDGGLPHALGVHSIQVLRANRSHPAGTGITGYTYNHQPYLTYWHGRFYLQFLSAEFQEHTPPTHTSVVTSIDGQSWSPPRIVFPEYELPAIHRPGVDVPAGMFAVMHQRMGFYVAPNGRLLTSGFYGYAATPQNSPNAGNGLGRVVREIHEDGSLGPIYFVLYNRSAGFDASNTSYPCYTASKDAGFVEACRSLLADKLYTLQWWEEDRGEKAFFAIDPSHVAGAAHFDANMVTSAGAGKAFDWFTRPDGVVVGLWKNQYSALTTDHGATWTPIVKNKTLWGDCGAKTWGQRTADGRYVIVGAKSATNTNRFPMVVMAGDDGHLFPSMYVVQGEVPPRRFLGQYKPLGPQYYRGITEGNGRPPGNDLWMVYSVSKEDIWTSRIHVPITGAETRALHEDFEAAPAAALDRWNLYMPQWAPTKIVGEPGTANHVLEIRDEDPYDYARDERLFPAASQLSVAFRVQPRQVAPGTLFEVEVQGERGERPMRLRWNQNWLSFDRGKGVFPQRRIEPLHWYDVRLDLDCATQAYTLRVNGAVVKASIPFAEHVAQLQRIVFRTGPYRGLIPAGLVDGGDRLSGVDAEDRPGADERAGASVYWLDDLTTSPLAEPVPAPAPIKSSDD